MTMSIPERLLVLDKAERLTNGELANEIVRCKRGITVAASSSARRRFETRLAIMTAEADRRMSQATTTSTTHNTTVHSD